jgi:hypothetical protein
MVLGHDVTLHGKDHMSGAIGEIKDQKSCLGKKISRKGAIWTAIMIIGMLLTSGAIFGVYGLEALKKDRDTVAENTNNIGKIQVELKVIKEAVENNQMSLDEIQVKQDEIQVQMEKHMIEPAVLKKLIEDAVKKGNEDSP